MEGLDAVGFFQKTGTGRPSSALSGMKRAAAAFATAAPTRTRMCENEEPTCAVKESGDSFDKIMTEPPGSGGQHSAAACCHHPRDLLFHETQCTVLKSQRAETER